MGDSSESLPLWWDGDLEPSYPSLPCCLSVLILSLVTFPHSSAQLRADAMLPGSQGKPMFWHILLGSTHVLMTNHCHCTKMETLAPRGNIAALLKYCYLLE